MALLSSVKHFYMRRLNLAIDFTENINGFSLHVNYDINLILHQVWMPMNLAEKVIIYKVTKDRKKWCNLHLWVRSCRGTAMEWKKKNYRKLHAPMHNNDTCEYVCQWPLDTKHCTIFPTPPLEAFNRMALVHFYWLQSMKEVPFTSLYRYRVDC